MTPEELARRVAAIADEKQAVDIVALNVTPVLGRQEPGGLTERTLWRILLLPAELEPNELISLFALGGPSFALDDHADHIHAGY